MYEIYLNNKILSSRKLKKIILSLQDKNVLEVKGGFLFKSSVNESEYHLGVIPVLIQGERSHHYDIRLDYEDDCVLSGIFNPDKTMGILFQLAGEDKAMESGEKGRMKTAYLRTMRILVDHGLSGAVALDWISRKIIQECGLFTPVPRTVAEVLSFE